MIDFSMVPSSAFQHQAESFVLVLCPETSPPLSKKLHLEFNPLVTGMAKMLTPAGTNDRGAFDTAMGTCSQVEWSTSTSQAGEPLSGIEPIPHTIDQVHLGMFRLGASYTVLLDAALADNSTVVLYCRRR